MDVTSMLNTNSGAVEQQRNQERAKEDISKTPTRNRTPWDAGGYSLPLNVTSSTPSTPPHISPYDDVHTFSPTSPRHKFSDSRSSLSSFTSSLQSATHSRFSSLSTVGSSQPLNSLSESLCESLSPHSTAPRSQSLELSAVPELYRPSISRTHSRGSLSPTDSLAALSIEAKESLRKQPEVVPHIVGGSPMSAIMEKESGNMTPPEERPCSPSDAILIRRPTLPSLRVLTSEQELNGPDQVLLSKHFLSAPLENNHHSLGHSKGHKRAISAPDFPASTINFNFGGPRGELTPPTSFHPDKQSPITMSEEALPPNQLPAKPTEPEDEADAEIVCMYIPNCRTGSQLRKAISHIFGRNKMCTRLIPDSVWVHYCRKHYQRSRYRNPKAYAELQCELVQKQIRRIHEWSNANITSGSGGYVKDWAISMRKREQKRLDDLNNNGKKRPATSMDEEYDSEGYEQMNPGHLPPTAVPQWLVDKCGSGYSTLELSHIFNRLHQQVSEEKSFLQFPDIELLPNIVGHVEQPKAFKGQTRRASAAGGHKRTQSLGVAAKPDYQSLERRSSQSSYGPEAPHSAPPQKRRRQVKIEENDLPERSPSVFGSRHPELGRHMPLPIRPNRMDYIPENQAESENYSYSTQHPPSHLMAPSPRRFNGQSMAHRLESGHPIQRFSHVRSRSDMSAVRQRFPSEQSYDDAQINHPVQQMNRAEPARSHYQTRDERWHPFPQQQTFSQPENHEMRAPAQHHAFAQPENREMPAPAQPRTRHHLPNMGHQRNHSTPLVQFNYSMTEHRRDSTPGPTLQPGFQPSFPAHQRQNPHITEDEQARTYYSSRR